MNEKDFFSKLAGVGPDGKFTGFSSADSSKNNFYKPNKGNNGNGNGKNGENENKVETNLNDKKMVGNFKQKSDDAERKENEAIDEGEEGQLAVDVYLTPAAFVIETAIAGVKGDDIDVAITIDSVTIKGRRTKEEKDSEREYLYQECFWGRFGRTVILPSEIDADRAVASFKNGILRVALPKILRDRPKKLRVRFDQ